MSRRTKLLILGLLLALLAIPVGYTAYTWRPVNPVRVRVLRSEAMQAQPAQEPWRIVHLEVQNISPVTIYLGLAKVNTRAGSYFILSSSGKRPLSSEVFGSDTMNLAGGSEVITLQPQERWQARALMPLSEAETGALKDCHMTYIYSSSTRVRIMKWYRTFVSYWPDSWRKHQFPDPWGGHLPTIDFHDALTPLEPAQATP